MITRGEAGEAGEASPMNYSGHFVSENAHENEYPAGSTFKRTFVMKNDGETSWPANVHFI